MAATEVKLPDIGEGVNEGEIVRWLVKEGDVVTHDQPLVEVMTDKATVEIPCSAAGKVVSLVAKEGAIVKVGGVLLTMETGAGAGTSAAAAGTGADSGAGVATGSAARTSTDSGAGVGAGASAGSRAPASTKGDQPKSAAAAQEKPSTSVGSPSNGGGQAVNAQSAASPQRPASGAQTSSAAKQGTGSGTGGGLDEAYESDDTDINPPPAGAGVLATPATRRYAREMGLDLNIIKGTGPAGRITRDDVVKGGSQGTGAVAAARPQFKAPAKPLETAAGALEERKPFRGIRRKIAENLVHSAQTIPHFTHADECDVTELVEWRTKMKAEAEAQGVKLTYLPFVMKALVATCREFPTFNASLDDATSEIVIKHNFNIGFAADTPEGLLVPVVKNVDRKSILEVAHDIVELAEKARGGKLAIDDMRHGTITITNIGSVGGIYATPIINHPEVAIIGIYKIQKKPVVIGNEIKIRDMMGITATCDHRILDGALAARFLNKLMKRLENPQSLLLEMI